MGDGFMRARARARARVGGALFVCMRFWFGRLLTSMMLHVGSALHSAWHCCKKRCGDRAVSIRESMLHSDFGTRSKKFDETRFRGRDQVFIGDY